MARQRSAIFETAWVNAAGNEFLSFFGGCEYTHSGHRPVSLRIEPVASYHFLNRLDTACELLAAHPLMGKLRYELAENLRSFAIGNYLIFYIPAAHGIDVVRVIYGGRDLPPLFQ